MRTIPQNPMTKILMSSGIYIHIKTIPRTLKFGKHYLLLATTVNC